MKYMLGVVLVLILGGCTDAERAQFQTIGSEAHIQCWSAGYKYYDGYSTGKVKTEEASDGWFFQEKGSDNLIRVSGPCIIRN